jgi:hypothetical protein
MTKITVEVYFTSLVVFKITLLQDKVCYFCKYFFPLKGDHPETVVPDQLKHIQHIIGVNVLHLDLNGFKIFHFSNFVTYN